MWHSQIFFFFFFNATDFCTLTLYPAILLNLFIGSNSVLVDTLGFSICNIVSFAISDSFASSLLVQMHFVSFFLIITVTRSFSVMLSKSGESGYPCLIPELQGNYFCFSPLNMVLAAVWSYIAFIVLRYVPFTPILLSVFIMNGCWVLSNAFLHLLRWSCIFLTLLLLTWSITAIYLQILNHSYIHGRNQTWSWCMDLFICCWFWFAFLLLRVFVFAFIRDIGL